MSTIVPDVNNRTSPDAISAVKGILGADTDEEVAADLVEAVRYYTERPLQIALKASNALLLAAQKEIAQLKAELEAAKATED